MSIGNPKSTPSLAALLACGAILLAGCGDSKQTTTTTGSDPSAAFEPAPGTYRYATKGYERVDALLGARHRYPATTRMIVRRRGCGYSERWQARAERYMQSEYCVTDSGARTLSRLTDFHEFFGYPEGRTYKCEGTAIPNLQQVKVGFRWVDRCRARKTRLTLRGKVAGREQIPVASQPLDTVHLRVVTDTTGAIDGNNVNDYWLAARNGLLVRRSVRGTATTSTPVGAVNSTERYTLRLLATEPRP